MYISFRLVPKSVTLNDLERRNGHYFALFQRTFVYLVAVKQLLGLPRFQNLLLIIYNHTRMWANAQPDGRPAEHRWRPLLDTAKFGCRPLLDAVQ